jgi:hypothetical protein
MTTQNSLRERLLELHKRLLSAARERYEREHGRMTPHAFWHALTSDPALAWLGPLNAAIVRLDELLDASSKGEDNAAELAEHVGELRALLTLDERQDAFAQHYAEHVHEAPEVTFAHGALWQLLRA